MGRSWWDPAHLQRQLPAPPGRAHPQKCPQAAAPALGTAWGCPFPAPRGHQETFPLLFPSGWVTPGTRGRMRPNGAVGAFSSILSRAGSISGSFFYKIHSSFVSPGCCQLQSTALSRRKSTMAAFQQLSALPPTKQGFPDKNKGFPDRNKAFLTQQSSCSSISESSHPLAVLEAFLVSPGIYPGGFLRFTGRTRQFIQSLPCIPRAPACSRPGPCFQPSSSL